LIKVSGIIQTKKRDGFQRNDSAYTTVIRK